MSDVENWEDLAYDDPPEVVEKKDDVAGKGGSSRFVSTTKVDSNSINASSKTVDVSEKLAERKKQENLLIEREEELIDNMFDRPIHITGTSPTAMTKKGPAMPSLSAAVSSRPVHPAAAAVSATGGLAAPLDSFDFDTVKGLETFSAVLSQKILNSKLKSNSWQRFANSILKDITAKMEPGDVTAVQNRLRELIKSRQMEQTYKNQKKKKPNDGPSARCRNAEVELDIVYGGGSADESEEEDDEEYYASFM